MHHGGTKSNPSRLRNAFSLMELLIVVMIIGVVYKLALNNFKKIDENLMEVSLKNLKEYLQKLPHEKSVKILCLDKCKECKIFVDGRIVPELEESFDDFLDDTMKVYAYDSSFIPFEPQKSVFFNKDGVEENVCFSYEIDKNGIGEQVLLEFKGRVYDYSSPKTVVPEYDSIEDAMRYKQDLVYRVLR